MTKSEKQFINNLKVQDLEVIKRMNLKLTINDGQVQKIERNDE